MPKRTDIADHPDHRRRPHRHRSGLRIRLFRHAGVQGAARRGLPHRPGQLQSGDDHDRSGHGRPHLCRADHAGNRRQDHREGALCSVPGGFALLPTMGGQTALNCALSLEKMGVLKKFDIEMIGASAEAIDKAEDRELFREAMTKIGLETPRSHHVKTLTEALAALEDIGLPAIIRPSFTLGGTGGGIAYNKAEFIDIVERGIDASPTSEVLIEESVLGWKEYEMEVVRDKADNCIIVCSIENIDPMGVHTGDSHHRRAGADADRQGISDHARRLAGGAARDRRRDRRLQRAIRGRSRQRPHDRHRDESARVALVGARPRRRRAFPSPRSPRSSRSATRSTKSPTTSPAARRRPPSSRRSITSSRKFRASPSRNSPAPSRF